MSAETSSIAPSVLQFPDKPKRRRKRKALPIPLRWSLALQLIDKCREQMTKRTPRMRIAAERDLIVLHLGLYLGLRISEICTIQVADFDFDCRTARVNNGKGGRDRVVPIPQRAFDVLRDWAERVGSGRMINGPNGEITARAIHLRVRRLGAMIGQPWVHPHTLRHACALRLLDTGMDIRRIQKWLGHESLAVTALYLDVMPIDLKEGADRM